MESRRSFLTGLGAALITAPAIVRAGSLMPVKQMIEPVLIGIDYSNSPDFAAQVVCFRGRYVWIYGKDRVIHFSKPCAEDSWTMTFPST